MKAKIVSFIMAICMVVTLVPSTVFAQSSSRETADLLISSAEDLRQFSESVDNGNTYSGKVVRLTNDIVFDGVTINNFSTIGSKGMETVSRELSDYDYEMVQFQGVFDGAGYTISGIDQTSKVAGLFAYVGSSGVVKNVNMKNFNFTNVNGASIAVFNKGTIENCYSEGSIQGLGNIAGLVYQNWGTIDNCGNGSLISMERQDTCGGIAAISSYGIIKNCYNKGNIINTSTSHNWIAYNEEAVGGIIGQNYGSTVENCYNIGNMSNVPVKYQYDEEWGDYYYCFYFGGIVGYNSGSIENCYNAGVIGYILNMEEDMREDMVVDTVGEIVGVTSGGIVANCFGQNSTLIGRNSDTVDKNNITISNSDMRSVYLLTMLNRNRGDKKDWLPWEFNQTSYYPTFTKNYKVTFDKIIGGYVNSDSSNAYKGKTVTLTATPNANCRVSFLTVTTKTGQTVTTKQTQNKYQFTMPAEDVVVKAGFETNYVVKVKKSKNGYVKSNRSYAFDGNKVTLTPVANKKYKLKAISVKTISGKKVPLKKVNGKYQFTMPKSNVIVSASFKKK